MTRSCRALLLLQTRATRHSRMWRIKFMQTFITSQIFCRRSETRFTSENYRLGFGSLSLKDSFKKSYVLNIQLSQQQN